MSAIHSTDPDFRVCHVSFDTLMEIQLKAEELGFANRWSSIDALRGQAEEGSAVLQSLMREERGGVVRSYRCLLLFPSAASKGAGEISTIDIDPATFETLERLDHDTKVREAFVRMFSISLGGVSSVSKQ